MSEDRMLAKIRGLLAQAEGEAEQGHEDAARTFEKKADDLIAKYGIDAAMLAAQDKSTDAMGRVKIAVTNPYGMDKRVLLNNIAIALRCKAVFSRHANRRRGESVATVIGFESDLRRFELLYTSLLMQATSLVKHQRDPYYNSSAAYRRSWLSGFTAAVRRRLDDAESRAQRAAEPSSGTGTALVLRDRSKDVDVAFKAAFPSTRSSGQRRLSGNGFADGREAGNRADLGAKRVGAQRSAITQ